MRGKILRGQTAAHRPRDPVSGDAMIWVRYQVPWLLGASLPQFAVLAGGEPVQVIGKPLVNRRLVVARKGG